MTLNLVIVAKFGFITHMFPLTVGCTPLVAHILAFPCYYGNNICVIEA